MAHGRQFSVSVHAVITVLNPIHVKGEAVQRLARAEFSNPQARDEQLAEAENSLLRAIRELAEPSHLFDRADGIFVRSSDVRIDDRDED